MGRVAKALTLHIPYTSKIPRIVTGAMCTTKFYKIGVCSSADFRVFTAMYLQDLCDTGTSRSKSKLECSSPPSKYTELTCGGKICVAVEVKFYWIIF